MLKFASRIRAASVACPGNPWLMSGLKPDATGRMITTKNI